MEKSVRETIEEVAEILHPCNHMAAFDTFGDFSKRERIEAISTILSEIRAVLVAALKTEQS